MLPQVVGKLSKDAEIVILMGFPLHSVCYNYITVIWAVRSLIIV